MSTDCNEDCLFLYESGCNECAFCTYCGDTLHKSGARSRIHFDHIRAKSHGGKTVVPVCHGCNHSKRDKGFKEWLRWLDENDRTRLLQIIDWNKGKRNPIALQVRDVRDEFV